MKATHDSYASVERSTARGTGDGGEAIGRPHSATKLSARVAPLKRSTN
jgi:hypothetical protein